MLNGVLLFAIFFLLVFLNVPIAISLAFSAMAMLISEGFDLSIVVAMMYSSISKYILVAIPFFILSGVIMEYAGISKRLIRFAEIMVGHVKGGLIIVTVVVCCFFAAISGSGPATVAALGGLLIPAMVNAGYNRGMSTALVSTAGGIGIVIPPSLPFVIYAVIAEVSVIDLFTAGIVPGILIGAILCVTGYLDCRNNKDLKLLPKATAKERWAAFKDALWGLMVPVIILGGIYSGLFTPTEAACVSAVYALFVGIFVYKEIKLKDLKAIFVEAGLSNATILFIIGCANVFAWYLTTSQFATNASQALLASTDNKYLLLLYMNIILLILGFFLDGSSILYISLPVMIPICKAIGVDLIHFGVIVIVAMLVGMVTPPVGVNLYVGARVGKISVMENSKHLVPYIIATVICLILVTYVPEISLFLPRLLQ